MTGAMTGALPAAPAGADSAALLERMTALHPVGIDLSLDRTWRLLADLGDPHLRLPPVVHIAGTNGKGSTLAMIRAGLEAAGLRVHAYTSPHLVRFHERIRLAGQQISEPALADILGRTLEANAGRPVTFFEATTCAALMAFAEHPADALLLEVGLGGRLDTTNVVDAPALTVITPVDYDHQAYLGETLAEIAGEKAGILKRGVPCVVARQAEAAEAVIEARAARLGAPLLVEGQHWHVRREGDRTVFQDEAGLLDLPLPALAGPHQIHNAGTALAALRALGSDFGIAEAACAGALANAEWPARMQRLTGGPLPARLPGAELWLDGGHNPHAAQAMAGTLRVRTPPAPLHLVFGMQGPRDAAATLAPFAGLAASVTCVPVPDEPGSRDPEELAAAARSLGLQTHVADSVPRALDALAPHAAGARVLIFGSLYLAGHVLRLQEQPG